VKRLTFEYRNNDSVLHLDKIGEFSVEELDRVCEAVELLWESAMAKEAEMEDKDGDT
jgi:hypothetical protein